MNLYTQSGPPQTAVHSSADFCSTLAAEHNIWILHAVCFSYDGRKDKWRVKSPSKQMGWPACLFMVCVQGASQQKAPSNICVHNCWSIAGCDWRILKSVLQRPPCSRECQNRKRSKTLFKGTPRYGTLRPSDFPDIGQRWASLIKPCLPPRSTVKSHQST